MITVGNGNIFPKQLGRPVFSQKLSCEWSLGLCEWRSVSVSTVTFYFKKRKFGINAKVTRVLQNRN